MKQCCCYIEELPEMLRYPLINTPLVSIVIPAYNHGSYLEESIESVLAQDYPNIELIVLNDGSTDETENILKKYKNQFYWETQQNLGQANTLNKGWGMAKGEILAYLSADDILLPQATRISVDCLLENLDVVLCYGDFQLIDPESRVIRDVVAPEYNYLEMVTKLICAPGPGAYFRRDAFAKVGGWNPSLRRFPDYDCWLRLGLFGRFAHIREQLAAFRIHEESQSFSQTTIERAEEVLRIIENYFRLPTIPTEIVLAKNEAIANASFVAAQIHLRSGRYRLGFRRTFEAICMFPKAIFSLRVLRMLANGLLNQLAHKILWKFRNRLNLFR